MELQHKQIEAIADNVQTVLNNELQSISKYKELENKFNNLQNAIFNPFNISSCRPEEEKAFGDYLRKGIVSEFVTKSLSTTTGEAGVVIVNNLNNKIVSTVNAKSVMRQLASIETISTSALDFIIEDGKFISGWIGEAEALEDNKQKILFNQKYLSQKLEISYEAGLGDKIPQPILQGVLTHIGMMYDFGENSANILSEIKNIYMPYRSLKI